MADINDIKATAQLIWPDAVHIDVIPSPSTHVSDSGSRDPNGFRLSAIHKDGSIIVQVMADGLEGLHVKLKERLRAKAKQ
jgi:hypothetical protein